jgi:hypothetical protein
MVLLLFASSYVFIFLKAFQQLNVVHDKYWWVVPTSMSMAFCEVFIIASLAREGFSLPVWAAVGLGSGLGAVTSMWIHKRAVR